MGRNATLDYIFETLETDSAPFLVVEIQWAGTAGTRLYCDRDPNDFENVNSAPIGAIPRVMEWGTYKIDLKDGEISARDAIRLSIADPDHEIMGHLAETPQQRRKITVYRMFDAPSIDWPTDRMIFFDGTTLPSGFRESRAAVEIAAEDASTQIKIKVGKRAVRSVFSLVDIEDEDKPLPIPWGRAQRVKGVLVSRPWETVTREVAPPDDPPVTLDILHHPDELGVLTGVGNPVDAWLGADEVTGYFTQSVDPDNVPSTFTITSQPFATLGGAPFTYISGTTIHFERERTQPPFLDISTFLSVGNLVRIWENGTNQWVNRSVQAFGSGGVGLFSAFSTQLWWFVQLDVGPNAGGVIQFIDAASVRRPWPAGTVLRARGNSETFTFCFSMLPVQAIHRVEGFGTIRDEAGANLKEFVFINPELYTSNLSDSTWSAGLGHNVATITFQQSPRVLVPELEEQDIYVTCTGFAPTAGDGTGTSHPANVIQEYLSSQHLIAQTGVTVPPQDTAEFDQWRTDEPTARWNFAQMEIQDGLAWIQRLAIQSHRVLQFCGGQVRPVTLINTPTLANQQITNAYRKERAVKLRQTDVKDLISHVDCNWRSDWDDKDGPDGRRAIVFNSTLRDTYGTNVRGMEIFTYTDRDDVVAELTFWQARWGAIWEILEFEGTALFGRLLPGDVIVMEAYTDGEGNVVFDGTEMLQLWAVSEKPGRASVAPSLKITAARPLFTF